MIATTILPKICDGPPEEVLSGTHGSNRASTEGLQISAENDLQALLCFLTEYEQSAGTRRIYERECERLILWAWVERHRPLSSLDRQDFEAYLNFLQNPQPAGLWCGPKTARHTVDWRPFVGPLGTSAVMTAIASINSFLGYLVDAGYLRGNPLGLIRQRGRKMRASGDPLRKASASQHTAEADKVERYLDEQMWAAVNAAVENMPQAQAPQKNEYERMRFILSLLYLMAPRAGDLESHTMASFRRERGLWWWHLVGKGDKAAKLPVPDDMVQALMRYRRHLGLALVPRRDEQIPLMGALEDPRRPITARRLNQVLKTVFSSAAEQLSPEQADQAALLRRASAHWGRHTSITRMDDAGLETRLVQKAARHSDPRTTQRYIHDEDKRWHDQSQKLRLNWRDAVACGPIEVSEVSNTQPK